MTVEGKHADDDRDEADAERADQLETIEALPDPDLEAHPYPALDELECTPADEFYES